MEFAKCPNPLNTMKHLFLSSMLSLTAFAASAQAPNVIYSYGIGDWRNGPVVTISPLFQTTEAYSTIELINWIRLTYPEFANISDIDVQRFATTEEGDLSRTTLKAKYEVRKLQVNLMADKTMRVAEPERKPRPAQPAVPQKQ